MSLVAGVDVGNSTTEVVVADSLGRPVAWDRSPTRGRKGSAESGLAAARLLARLERRTGRSVDAAVLTEQHPVVTDTRDVTAPVASTGRVSALAAATTTTGRAGVGTGVPRDVEGIPSADGPVVLVARDPLGFRRTVARVSDWLAVGADIRAVLLAGDEARLVSARIPVDIPVVDGVDVEGALACTVVMVEVAPPGAQVRQASDPIALAAALALDPQEHGHARRVAAASQSVRAAVVGVLAEARHVEAPPPAPAWPEPPVDVWTVDLPALATLPGLRPGAVARMRTVSAALLGSTGEDDHITAFGAAWHGRVLDRSSEAAAGRRGALTTPGVGADALIIDLGGGTVDVTSPAATWTVAGSGVLLTTCVADILDTPLGLAEWVKRGPASRVETPHLVVREDGAREFVDPPAPAGSVGWLVAPGPSGDLPFSRRLMTTEWRALRRAVKQAVLADNLARVLARTPGPHGDVLLVGGPAGDDEAVEIVNAAVPGIVAGRADVAGRLGHRWAVAYGLALVGVDG